MKRETRPGKFFKSFHSMRQSCCKSIGIHAAIYRVRQKFQLQRPSTILSRLAHSCLTTPIQMWYHYFFVVLACHLPELDGPDWHYQASAHCPKQCHHNITATVWEKFLWMPRIKPGAAGWKARMLSLSYAAPSIILFYISGTKQKEIPLGWIHIVSLSSIQLNIGLKGH